MSHEQCNRRWLKKKAENANTGVVDVQTKWTLSICLASLFIVNLFYYLTYFCYYLWVSLYLLVLFMGTIVIFQLTFTFIYSTFSKKFSISVK